MNLSLNPTTNEIFSLVDALLETYELDKKRYDRLRSCVRNGVIADGHRSFESIYEYVDSHVITSGEFRYFKSLDAPIKEDSATTFGELLGAQDAVLEYAAGDRQLEDILEDAVPLSEIITQLPHGGKVYRFLERITQNYELGDHYVPNDTIARNDFIKKISQLARLYLIHGELDIPDRPIKKIEFDPPRIIFDLTPTQRSNILDYFLDNTQWHTLTRKEFRWLEPVVHHALQRDELIDIALPIEVRGGRPATYKGMNPLVSFYMLGGHETITRTQLNATNRSLYQAMVRSGLIEYAIPLQGSQPFPGIQKKRSLPLDQRESRKQSHKYRDVIVHWRANPHLHTLSRSELHRDHLRLYQKMSDAQLLDEFIPKLHPLDDFNGDPRAYWEAHSELHGLGRKELEKECPWLYTALRVNKALDDLIPVRRRTNYVTFAKFDGDPRQYYLDREETFSQMSLNTFRKEHLDLWRALHKSKNLDVVNCKKMPRPLEPYDGDPIAYLNAHPELCTLSRDQLNTKRRWLVKILRDAGILDELFPKRKPGYPAKKKKKASRRKQ